MARRAKPTRRDDLHAAIARMQELSEAAQGDNWSAAVSAATKVADYTKALRRLDVVEGQDGLDTIGRARMLIDFATEDGSWQAVVGLYSKLLDHEAKMAEFEARKAASELEDLTADQITDLIAEHVQSLPPEHLRIIAAIVSDALGDGADA